MTIETGFNWTPELIKVGLVVSRESGRATIGYLYGTPAEECDSFYLMYTCEIAGPYTKEQLVKELKTSGYAPLIEETL